MGKLWWVDETVSTGYKDEDFEAAVAYDLAGKVGYVKKKPFPVSDTWLSRNKQEIGAIHTVIRCAEISYYYSPPRIKGEEISPRDFTHKARTVAEGKLLLEEWYAEKYPNGRTSNQKQKTKFLPSGNKEFYPTPEKLAGQMIGLVDWRNVKHVLEPSAGKGDLLTAIHDFKKSFKDKIYHSRSYDSRRWNPRLSSEDVEFDCIELDPDLRSILTGKGFRVVADDFLHFHTLKHYDLIFMNPPFSNGDEHLLKALQMQERGGQIVCLLNAETLRNPYTNKRKNLFWKLRDYEAKIIYVKDAFRSAERKTDVEIAIVYVNIPAPEETSKIFDHLVQAEMENYQEEEAQSLVSGNWMEQLVSAYDFEAKAGMAMMKEFFAMKHYRLPNDEIFSLPILSIQVNGKSADTLNECINAYLIELRRRYWSNLFQREELTKLMTSAMRDEYMRKIDTMVNYDFTLYNIRQMMLDLSMQLCGGVEDSIMKLFDKLSVDHSWYPECKKNRHYFDGWKTNQAHKVGMKAIVPTNGCFATYSTKLLDEYRIYELISDLDRALQYLDNGETVAKVAVQDAVRKANEANKTTVEFTYFKVRFYKKGTAHFTFYPEMQPLIDRLNIFAAQKRGWLPPNYGKSYYGEMSAEEKAVVDSFDGDGTEGSGAARYNNVMGHKSDYFLDIQASGMLMLGAGA